jgi:hypothetical protein
MPELAVTPLTPLEHPAILFQTLNHHLDLHLAVVATMKSAEHQQLAQFLVGNRLEIAVPLLA